MGASKTKPVTGKAADVLLAAHLASEAALRLLRPGKTNYDVTNTVQKIVKDEFDCSPVEGMLSSELRRHIMDGDHQIILAPTDQQRKNVANHEFALGEMWSVDILVSSSAEGKTKPSSTRTTIFKRIPNATYDLKTQTGRKTLNDISKKAGFMVFSLSNLDDAAKARVGVAECAKGQLLMPFDILEEKSGSTR